MTTEANNTGEGDAAIGAESAAPAANEGAAAEATAAVSAETGGGIGAAPADHVRPEGIPDAFWDDATGLKVGDLAAAYRDLTAKEAERTADVPAETEAYNLALPEGFEKPEGYDVEIKADDPLWAGFQAIGKKHGIPRAAFTDFVGEFAKYQIQNAQADVDAYVAAKTALGANADVRIKAAESWLGANLPKAEAQALGGALISTEGIKAVERLIALKSGPRAAENVGASVPAAKTSIADSWYSNTQPGAQ